MGVHEIPAGSGGRHEPESPRTLRRAAKRDGQHILARRPGELKHWTGQIVHSLHERTVGAGE